MKILFISELGHTDKVSRDYTHMRTEFAQMCALQSDHLPIYKVNEFGGSGYDHIILLLSKSPQLRDFILQFDIVEKVRQFGKKVWFMQEATSWIFQDLPIHQQFWHYNVLMDVDGILTENRTDIPYFRGLVGGDKPIWNIQSLMITDDVVSRSEWADVVILG